MKAAVDLRLSDPSQPPQLHISRRAARCCTPPPHGLIPTCGCVHVSVCLGAEELTSGSCYESSTRISSVFFGHVVSDRMRSGQVLLTCATSPSLHLLLLGCFFSSPSFLFNCEYKYSLILIHKLCYQSRSPLGHPPA